MTTTYLSAQEIAQILKVSYDKALDFIKYSGVAYVKIGRQYRVSAKALEQFLDTETKPKTKLRQRSIVQIVERRG